MVLTGPETTFSVGSLHPMVQSYQELSKMWKDIQNPQKTMPNEGIFALVWGAFRESNSKILPFWYTKFLSDTDWDKFMKVPKDPDKKLDKPEDIPELKDADEDNLWMVMANPYMKAVKHDEAAKEALKNKKPVWVGCKQFKYSNVIERKSA